jgi:hypothetical protein
LTGGSGRHIFGPNREVNISEMNEKQRVLQFSSVFVFAAREQMLLDMLTAYDAKAESH